MVEEQSDAQLVSRCREGDAGAWNEFVERFSRYVYAISSRGFRLAQHDAEDVFQEVFARAYERLSELRSDDAVRPWLAQLTRRLCIDRLRLLARDTPAETDPDELEVDDVLGNARRRDGRALRARQGGRPVPRDPRPLLLPRRELSHDRRRPRHPGRDDRQPHLALPRESPCPNSMEGIGASRPS